MKTKTQTHTPGPTLLDVAKEILHDDVLSGYYYKMMLKAAIAEAEDR